MRPSLVVFGPANLGPYHMARYSKLASRGLDLCVVRANVPEKGRPWRAPPARGTFDQVPLNVSGRLLDFGNLKRNARKILSDRAASACTLVGYNRSHIWAGAAAARSAGIPRILHLVGWEDESPRRASKEFLKSLFVRFFVDAALVVGTRSLAYAHRLGIPAQRIWIVGNAIDHRHFIGSTTTPRLNRSPRFLTVARLNKEKNLDFLLEAYGEYRERGGTWALDIAGEGPLRDHLPSLVPSEHAPHVRWLGWVPYEDLPALYQGAGAFVLPSSIEPWGLAVNEAMATGSPVIVSQKVGCQPDLCVRGVNGFDFDPKSRTSLVNSLEAMEQLPGPERELMGRRSQEIVARFSVENWVESYYHCVSVLSEERADR